jgi:predicted nucleic acid-binding protein
MCWLLMDGNAKGQAYSERVLEALSQPGAQAVVPITWTLEIGNVLARAEARELLNEAQSEAFLEMLSALPILVDEASAARALADTLQLARRHGLSTYDASYLDCALRRGWPLATLDTSLAKAARSVGLSRF